MKVLLVDVDSLQPNLALMKLSAHHKAQGDTVGWHIGDPDLVYASIVFKKNRYKSDGLRFMHPDAKIVVGGSGFDLSTRLEAEIENIKPDYDLYPDQAYSMGFTTRGCTRRCRFCIVPQKEGRLTRAQHPQEFHDDRFDTIMIMDNNWVANKDWFMETSAWIRDQKLRLIEGGMDIRYMTPQIAARLNELKWAKPMKFAYDDERYGKQVTKGLEVLKEAGVPIRHRCMFYVYLDSNDGKAFDSALARCRALKGWGVTSFVMFNIDRVPSERTKWLRHWANRPALYWSCDYKDYERSVVRKRGLTRRSA
jgi:hypothetical protein